MATEKLKYLSESSLRVLRSDVMKNIELYRAGDFLESSFSNGWCITSETVRVDSDKLSKLDGSGGASADIENSIIVYEAFDGMTPALAMEERVWTRFTHLECLQYSRDRWPIKGEEQKQTENVLKHFFAPGRTGVRDDNAISRLWWNMHIAKIADPGNPLSALRLILKSADIRMAIIERPNTAARIPIIRGLMRTMQNNIWITSAEKIFRQFMVELNRDAGGVLFEVLPDAEVDAVMLQCAAKTQQYFDAQ